MKTTQKNLVRPGLPYHYSGFMLTTRPDGTVDLIDPATGNWINNSTQRYARWRASVVANFAAQLSQCARPVEPPPMDAVRDVSSLTKEAYVPRRS